MVAEDGPGNNDLGSSNGLSLGGTETVGNSLDLGGIDEQRDVPAVVTESGVRSDNDVLLGAIFDQRKVGDTRVTLDLVDSRDNAGGSNDSLKLDARQLLVTCSVVCGQ